MAQAIGGVEVFCFFVAVSLNVLCYLLHSMPQKWRACGCPKRLLYLSNRAANADVENESYFALSSMDGRHLTTSFFLPRRFLLLLRFSELAFFVTVIVCDGTTGDKFGSEFPWPAFFTSWCFVVFGAWALVGTALTASDLWGDSRALAAEEGEERAAAERRQISGTGEKEQEQDDQWRRSEEAAAAAAACSSAPATPQRGGARDPRTATATSEDLEAAASSDKKKTSAAPSPASSSVTATSNRSSSNSADSRRPLTATATATATTKTKERRRRQPSSSSPPQPPLPPLPMDLPHKIYSLLSSVAGPAAIFVALMYWLVLRRFIERASPGKPFDPVDAMLHGGNALFVILDVVLSRVPAASSHFQVTLAYGTAYSIFIWSFERATGKFLYGQILAWSRPTAVGFYGFALPGALLACFAFWCLLAAGREKLGGKMAKRREAAAKNGGEKTEEEQEEKEQQQRKGNDEEEEKRTQERTQRWTENCASLPSLSTMKTKTDSSPSSSSLV